MADSVHHPRYVALQLHLKEIREAACRRKSARLMHESGAVIRLKTGAEAKPGPAMRGPVKVGA